MKTLYTALFALCALHVIAQPANDFCADAIEIAEVTDFDFSNIDASTDGPYHEDSPCPGTSFDQGLDSIYNDIWYRYTATFTGNCLWTLCGTADFDTKIGVYVPGSPCPPADEDLLTCNEDASGCAIATSEVIFAVEEGQTYLLRLGGYGDESPGFEGSGTFTISEFIPKVPNDFCDDAIPIEIGEGYAINTNGATTDGPDHPDNSACFGFGDITVQSDIWYSFTPNITGTVAWSTCDMVSFDSRLAIYGPDVSCPVTTEDLYACNDDGGGCGSYTSQVIFDVDAGSTYLLRVGGYIGETGTGTFDLVTTETPEPPANNLCENAQEVTVNEPGSTQQTDGTTINATFDLDNFTFPLCLPNQAGGEFAEVWYSFNSNGYPEIELTFVGVSQDAIYFVDVWENCTSGPIDTLAVPASCFGYDLPAGTIYLDTLSPLNPEPTEYIMRVATRLTSDLPGDFFFLLNETETSSAHPVTEIKTMTLYPNPVRDNVSIEIHADRPYMGTLTITDLTGGVQMTRKSEIISGPNRIDFATEVLPPGVYVARFVTGNQSWSTRFVKQ